MLKGANCIAGIKEKGREGARALPVHFLVGGRKKVQTTLLVDEAGKGGNGKKRENAKACPHLEGEESPNLTLMHL